MRYPNGKSKAVTLSYDDGRKTDMRLSDILTPHNMKCTFNICSSKVGSTNVYLTKDEIRKYILERGHEVAIHGAHHRANGLQRVTAGMVETLDCRRELERMFDTIIKGMAYPNSGILHIEGYISYEKICRYLSDVGIVYARSLKSDNNRFELPSDWYNWIPTASHLNENLFEYVKEFNELIVDDLFFTQRYPRLFYLWGHSYELEDYNKWDMLEKFCSEIGGKDDVWYATNMEIYEYTKAYNSLQFNVDETIVYNPSLLEIWFCADGKIYSVKSGETVKLGGKLID